MSDAAGTTHYSYDPDGRLISETRTVEGVTFITGYAYDQAGTLREIHYPTGQIVAYQPDAADPARTGAVILNESQILASNLSYLPFGPLNALTLGNGLDIAKTFDPNYQVKTIAHGTLLQRTYSVDNVGNITAITDNLDATRSQAFGYDEQYRLTSATGKYGAIAYTYDKVGNRRSRSHGSLSDSYDYYQGTNRLQSIIGAHAELFEYDDEGNTIRRTPAAGNPAPPITDPNTYSYDSSGRRVKKAGQSTTLFHFDQAGQLLAETDDAGNLIKAYVWLDGQPLAQIAPNGSISYYHNDHLGTPQKMTDATGTTVWSADYLPFGQADVTVAGVENNLRFAGQYYDSDTGLHYNYFRYYDPGIGRYLRADPIGLAGGINLYAYVAGNPIKAIDPNGLSVEVGGGFGFTVPGYHFNVTVSTDTCCDKNNRKHKRTIVTTCAGFSLGLEIGGGSGPGGGSFSWGGKMKSCKGKVGDDFYEDKGFGFSSALIGGASWDSEDPTRTTLTIGLGISLHFWSRCNSVIKQDVNTGDCCNG